MASKKVTSKNAVLFWKIPQVRKLFLFGLLPALIYFIFFCFYSWPWITHFSSHFFTDSGDGLQNIWNMWWVEKSVTDFTQLPWHTDYLHYPYGVTLLGQTLAPFNGFVGIVLSNIFGLSLVQAFNTMVIFSFVMGGITAFWLCYYFTKRYTPSVIGGFIFTFSSYHFAHAIGHMQLVSLEWIPLFVLVWWKFLKKPTYRLAVGAALSLLLVLLCDYYYFLYSVVIAGFIFGYLLYKKEPPSLKNKKTLLPLTVFLGTSVALVAPLPLALLRLNAQEVLSGFHPARLLSTDVFTPFITGGFWKFHELTDWYWDTVPAFEAESSVYLGLSVITVVIIGFIKRKKLGKDITFWLVTGLIFGILSLGPRLLVAGNTIESIPMPYALAENIFPFLKLSGTPVRMMVIVILATAIISAIVLSQINLSRRKGKLILGAFCLVLFVELWPDTLPLTPAKAPAYVYKLKTLPAGAVFDNGAVSEPQALYNQTIYEKPMALGYISRTPKSTEDKDQVVKAAVLENRHSQLCTLKIRYFTTPDYRPLTGEYKIVYKDKKTIIYDLKNKGNSC